MDNNLKLTRYQNLYLFHIHVYSQSTCFFFGPMISRLVALQTAFATLDPPNDFRATSSLSATDMVEIFSYGEIPALERGSEIRLSVDSSWEREWKAQIIAHIKFQIVYLHAQPISDTQRDLIIEIVTYMLIGE